MPRSQKRRSKAPVVELLGELRQSLHSAVPSPISSPFKPRIVAFASSGEIRRAKPQADTNLVKSVRRLEKRNRKLAAVIEGLVGDMLDELDTQY